MDIRETAPGDIKGKIKPIENGGFRFACHPGVPCFTECCRDLNLQLTPYDVVRLKNRLGLSSDDFLDRHTDCGLCGSQPIPTVYLLMNPDERRTCPFVSPRGCLVYEDRPSACRIYPIARASRLHRVHGTVLENYFVLQEDHCLGFKEDRNWEIAEWMSDQGLDDYSRYNDLWMSIITHPNFRNAPLPQKQQQMFFIAAYNSDGFRKIVFQSRFLGLFQIDDQEIEKLRISDAALLDLAFRWIRFSFFGEAALKPRNI